MSTTDEARRNSLHRLSELEYILLGDLRDVLEEEPDEQNRKWTIAIVSTLLDTVPQEFHLREHGGYMAEVLQENPAWDSQVRQLKSEHMTLVDQLRQLRQRLEDRHPFCEICEGLRRDLRDWMHNLAAHNRHESRLIQDAMNVDTGAGD